MTCDHYWREGVSCVEHGEPDPHRETCAACRHAHAERAAMLEALPLIGRDPGPADWEARVWRQIARLEPPPPRRRWQLAALASAAAAIALGVVWWRLDDPGTPGPRATIEIVHSAVAMRSAGPVVGDRIDVTAEHAGELRIYRDEVLVQRCAARASGAGCAVLDGGIAADAEITAMGTYRVVVLPSPVVAPVGDLDRDLAAVVAAGGDYQITELTVR